MNPQIQMVLSSNHIYSAFEHLQIYSLMISRENHSWNTPQNGIWLHHDSGGLELWQRSGCMMLFRLHDVICRFHFHSNLASSLFYVCLLQFIDWILYFHCVQNGISVGASHKYCVVASKLIRNYCQATGEHWCWICSWPLHSVAIATSIPFHLRAHSHHFGHFRHSGLNLLFT